MSLDTAFDADKIRARTLMQPATALKPTMSLAQARDLLIEQRISGAPVCDATGALVGVFSQTDFVRAIFSLELGDTLDEVGLLGLASESSVDRYQGVAQRLQKSLVADYMSTTIFSVGPDESLSVVAALMRKHHIHRVFITEHGQLLGLISAFDLLSLLAGK